MAKRPLRISHGDKVLVEWVDAFTSVYPHQKPAWSSQTVGFFLGRQDGFIGVAQSHHELSDQPYRDITYIPLSDVKRVVRLR